VPKMEDEPVERIHILLYKKDIEILRQYYTGNPGVGPAVRMVVRQFIRRLTQSIEEKEDAIAE
jgi:hypothetical protein